ncbi:hypothetical protein A4X13_0g3019 [Tilletia indica]|uniref:Uncharacterized protein n=1 Tax=Tilletia indica TaxID=43049 RepID=A0A177TFW6_9BASI|nr:hypothetical protein A4X13_0g3019 [Tilletia indica]
MSASTSSAPSPFIGKRVHLSLTSGGSYTGAITALDPTTRAIQIRDDRTTATFTIRADEVQDMRFLNDDEQQKRPLPTPAQSGTTHASSSSSSFMRPLEPLPVDFHAEATPSTAAEIRALDEEPVSSSSSGLPPSAPTPAATTGANSKKKSRAERRKKKASSTTPAENAIPADNGDGAAADAEQQGGSNKVGFQEDFDFEGALRTFDKAKIWEEIRRADQTDPDTLLVSHNRIGGGGGNGASGATPLKRGPNGVGPSNAISMSARFESGDDDDEDDGIVNGSPRRVGGVTSSKLAAAAARKGRNNGQTKLGINEMVISPTASDDEDEAGEPVKKSGVLDDAAEEDEEEDKAPQSPTANGEGLLNSIMASMSGFASAARSAMGGNSAPATPTKVSRSGNSQHADEEGDDDDDGEDESILIPSSASAVPPSTKKPEKVIVPQSKSSASTSGQEEPSGQSGSSSSTVVELQDEVARLLERISVLEALGGVEVKEATTDESRTLPSSSTTTSSTKRYTCTVRPTGPGNPTGHLRFGLSTTFAPTKSSSSSTSSSFPKLKTMRYLGALPAPEHSDVDAKEALPAKYANPMGLSAESAGVFVRRLRDGVYGSGR